MNKYFNEDLTLKGFLTPDKSFENFLKSFLEDTKQYEKVRQIIINKNFDKLSLLDINLCAAAINFTIETWTEMIANLTKAKEEAITLRDKLFSRIQKS